MARRQVLGPFRVLAFTGLGLGAWLTFSVALGTQAHSDPIADDGVPSGTIAYFSGGACPAGWQTATAVQGRLVLAVADGSKVGTQVGTPLGDQEDRQHQHTYAGSEALGSGGPSDGAARRYTMAGTTETVSTSLPFVQVQPCVKH